MYKTIRTILSIVLIFVFVIPIQPVQAERLSLKALYAGLPETSGVNRVRIGWSSDYQRGRLDKLGIKILEEGKGWALVLVSSDQLESLARLRYEIHASDDLGLLMKEGASESDLFAQSFQGAAQSLAALDFPDSSTVESEKAQADLIESLAPEQAALVADASSIDDDADGLTNTQEDWWCTDPADPDSDSDGTTDGAEIQALKDWVGNRRAGPPGGTPWPAWPFNDTACPDKDHDSIPNLAERWELGLNMDWESSDHDKFDDGQEAFGVTYCPGGDLSCGYGDLPRSSDSGYVGGNMPAWVKAPGNHPLVTAFPVPEMDMVPSSLRVQTVIDVTTDHVISSGTEKSYSTAKTEGTSTSVADTITWNNWQESFSSTETVVPSPSAYLSLRFDSFSSETPLFGQRYFGERVQTLEEDWREVEQGCKFSTTGTSDSGNVGIDWKIFNGGYTHEWSSSQTFDTALTSPICITYVVRFCDKHIGELSEFGKDFCTRVNKIDGSQNSYSLDQNNLNNQATIDNSLDYGNLNHGLEGMQLSINDSGELIANRLYEIEYAISAPRRTEGERHGNSWGGAQTTTTEQYEEQTITNGEAFSNAESWGDATAVDSAHAADLRFTYQVRNNGMEYARQICNLTFNVYIGDDPNPATTYFVGPDLGGDGCFANFMPDEEHTYTSRAIPLSLYQMKAIDLGGTLRITLEDYTYGVDELYYQDAANSGVLLAMEDGTDDGDEAIDTYLIPTWGEETVLDVLARYFPHTLDENDSLTAVWTPEQRTDTPAWCADPQRYGNTLWCKHALSTADWWNIYTNGMGDGTEGFQDTLAVPGQTALFRFNQDSDLDGYSDRSEARLGSDPNDAGSFPHPELLAGMHSIQSGNHVTATLSLLNTGLYDAYGVEAVMIAPNDTISITNNTVGGSGRVRAQNQVVVGSHVTPQSPLPSAWTQAGHAMPSAGGYFTGTNDLNYTFTVSCVNPGGCTVGSGTWSLNWGDGQGSNGSLNFGAGYLSPNPISAGAFGVKMALLTGKVYNGESFTIAATTPRDTFQYTVNQEPHSDPIVIVSYNDPQGNHRFILPSDAMNLASPTDNLAASSGEMLRDPGVEIVTTSEFAPGSNTTGLLVNNPSGVDLADSHLFLEFIDPEGTVVLEKSAVQTLPEGPSNVDIAWNTAEFNPAYDSSQDYIVMAFWTDLQGNILDTAGRPLSSFQVDPAPASEMAAGDELWDFGTAQQGTLMQRQFSLASVGYMDLLTSMTSDTGITVEGPASAPVAVADTAVYTVTINTQYLPIGPYEKNITVRTSDMAHPERTITIRGEITAMPEDGTGGAIIRPLDWTLNITGTHSAGEWITYTHTLGPDPESLHPVKVYSQDYATLLGVGKYAADFGQGTTSYDMFGDGRDGDLAISSNTTDSPIDSSCYGTVGTNTLYATNGSFQAGQKILIHQSRGANAGAWEINQIAGYSAGNITTMQPLGNTYVDEGASQAQVLLLRQYHDVMINAGISWSAKAWNGDVGGMIAFLANGKVAVNGIISANGGNGNEASGGVGGGFRGGNGISGSSASQYGGEGTAGISSITHYANGNGGGGGTNESTGGTGAGGGNSTTGSDGHWYHDGIEYGHTSSSGDGGSTSGIPDLTIMTFGGGGGAGGGIDTGQAGGAGGGIIFISANNLAVSGSLTSQGGNGAGFRTGNNGGGGAGGSIFVKSQTAALGSGLVTAVSGGTPWGGTGSYGRIRIEYCESISGNTNPSASIQQLQCFIVEKIESTPDDRTRLNLPDSFSSSKTYQIQYSRRFEFAGASQDVKSIRIPKQIYAANTLQALVSNTGVASGPLNLQIDIGDDGGYDWTYNRTTDFPATLNITNTVDALNNYLVSRTDVAWGDEVDVPFKLDVNRQADVILTNLQLSLQFNQPAGGLVPDMQSGADRPLDWPVYISGSHNQGEWIEFDHTIGPDSQSIHPVKVFNQDYTSLWGVGKYATDFRQGTASYDMFGDGRDGVMPSSGNLDTSNGFGIGSINGTTGSTSITVVDKYSVSRINPGDYVLIHQTRGTGSGMWELNRAISDFSGSGIFTLAYPLAFSYKTDGYENRAQITRVPQYSQCNVTGTVTPLVQWNGEVGGIFVVMCENALSVSGAISADHYGFRGGDSGNGYSTDQWQGEGILCMRSASEHYCKSPDTYSIDQGGGAADQIGGGGGGGGYSNGNDGDHVGGSTWGSGGIGYGSTDPSKLFFGGGGGGGATSINPGTGYSQSGRGGGIIFVIARQMNVSGQITADGQQASGVMYDDGTNRRVTAGSGGGGQIFARVGSADLGTNRLTATGGPQLVPPAGGTGSFAGGAGGNGQIQIEHCDVVSGTTLPVASLKNIDCWIAEQVDSMPYSTTRLNLPRPTSEVTAYEIQFGRRVLFSSPGEQTSYLRMTRQLYGSASIDALVSNTGVASGALDLCLDFGNDGTCDFTHNQTTNFPAAILASGFVDALNNYMLSQSQVNWGDPIDVPVRVSIDRAAQVMLTNLALTPSGAKTRFLRLPARNYSDVHLSLKFLFGSPSSPLSFSVDVGADNGVDCSFSNTVNFPAVAACPQNLASAVNAYLAGRSGDVDIPLRIIPSPFLDTYLESVEATPANKPDLALSSSDISFSSGNPVESDEITIQATIHNNGGAENRPSVASFFAAAPGWGDWYLGSKLIPSLSPGGSTSLSLPWDTLGFYGDLPVKVALDSYGRIDEASETNNLATRDVTIKTRADLAISELDEPEVDFIDTLPATVSLQLDNLGQTDAGSSVVALYDGNPDEGGALIGEQALSASAGGHTSLGFDWTPNAVGAHRLFAVADRDGAIDEANKSNNLAWKDVVVGLKSPVLIDSGVLEADPAYDPAVGYGYVDQGLPDVLTACGSGTQVEQTLRRDPDGQVLYKFDHLVPSHYYHLDVILYECDGAGRQESVVVDGYTVAGPEDLGDGEVHRLSLLIDPALYVDRTLDTAIQAAGINGAVVGAVNLHDVDYRYVDAGNTSDLAYSETRGFGWLDPSSIANVTWGRLPYQSLRIDQSDDNLTYRYDRLKAERDYKVHLTLWQKDGAPYLQKILIDGIDTNLTVNSGDFQLHRETINVPQDAYSQDGSIQVTIQRLGADGAMLNEISLEEETLLTSAAQVVTPTPYFSDVFGDVMINVTPQSAGEPAPVGTTIQAYDPRGVLVGSFTVTTHGTYGYMRVYGEDKTSTPPIPGLQEDELVSFKINGAPAVAKPSFYWQDDHLVHRVDLFTGEINQQSILLAPGWNFMSFYYEPPSPVLANVLQSIFGRYDRVLSETGVFVPELPPEFITLRELHAGQAYFTRITGTTSANLLVDGIHQAPDTPLQLHQGWNWIGYMPSFELPIEQALQNISGKFQLVHSLYYAHSPSDPEHSTLHTMSPGEGYMIYMSEAATLIYPSQPSGDQPNGTNHTSTLRELGVTPAPDFMTIYGSILTNGEPAPAGAFIQVLTPDGVVAGAAIVEKPGILGFTHVFGEPNGYAGSFQPGEPLAFKVNGVPAEADRQLTWTNDGTTYSVNLTSIQKSIYLPVIRK